jgi:hypothetical protein
VAELVRVEDVVQPNDLAGVDVDRHDAEQGTPGTSGAVRVNRQLHGAHPRKSVRGTQCGMSVKSFNGRGSRPFAPEGCARAAASNLVRVPGDQAGKLHAARDSVNGAGAPLSRSSRQPWT